jgi:hypothetical protein
MLSPAQHPGDTWLARRLGNPVTLPVTRFDARLCTAMR